MIFRVLATNEKATPPKVENSEIPPNGKFTKKDISKRAVSTAVLTNSASFFGGVSSKMAFVC